MDFSKLKKRKEAMDLLLENWAPRPETEFVELEDAEGYVLAENQYAAFSIPVVRASGMDGIAVRYDDFSEGIPDTSSWVEGREYVRADTGDDFDDAYDTVIPIERVTILEQGGISLDADLKVEKGMHVLGKGSMLWEGQLLAEKGTRLQGRHLAALASGGVCQVPVIRKPRVGFIPTGSELIPAGTTPRRGQNIDSNSILAKSMLREMGAEPICYPIVKDRQDELSQALDKALSECDIVIINAGSSKGKEDFNTRLLRSKGKLLCHGVAAVPGRPMGVAVIEGKAVINIPGPSMAAFYGLDWMIHSIVCKWLGIPLPKRPVVQAELEEDLPAPPFFERMAFVELSERDGKYFARPHERGEKGRRHAMSAEGVFVSSLGKGGLKKGEIIEVEWLD